MSVCVYMRICVCVYMRMCVCAYVSMCACVYVCMDSQCVNLIDLTRSTALNYNSILFKNNNCMQTVKKDGNMMRAHSSLMCQKTHISVGVPCAP